MGWALGNTVDVDPQPYLLLDVDGVLAIEGPNAGWQRHELIAGDGSLHSLWLRAAHGPWLRILAAKYELVWATGWQYDAPQLLSPLLGCPPMEVIEFSTSPQIGARLDKLPDVAEFVGDRPAAWVDDELGNRELEWAQQRSAPTLLIRPDPAWGLTEAHVDELLRFAAS